jgi:dTDP-4-dehydrorhamnose reductase
MGGRRRAKWRAELRVVVVGASGQVGAALSRHLRARGDEVVGTHHRAPGPDTVALDITDRKATRELITSTAAQAIFFASAFTHVDGCEDDPGAAFTINRDAPAAAARAAASRRAAFVFYSTEYVFDGTAGPYAEDDPVQPLSVYGRSKLEGEAAVLAAHPEAVVIRTTVLYGFDPQGKNFAYQVLRRARAGDRITAPMDQRSSPTYVEDLAAASLALVDKRLSGVFHVAGPDVVPRDEFARAVCRAFALDPGLVQPVATASLAQQAPRPLNAGLRTDRVASFGIELQPPAAGLAAMRAALEAGHG